MARYENDQEKEEVPEDARSLNTPPALLRSIILGAACCATSMAASKTDPEYPLGMRKGMACLQEGRKPAPAVRYERCMSGFHYMNGELKIGHDSDDQRLTTALLEIFAGRAAHDMHREAESRKLQAHGASVLRWLGDHSASEDIRDRAETMGSCLIDRDPQCLKEWDAQIARDSARQAKRKKGH